MAIRAKLWLVFALCGCTAVLVAACGGSSGSGGGSGTGGGVAKSSTGRTLVQLDTEVAPSLDPDGADAADPAVQEALNNLGGFLVTDPYTKHGAVLQPNFKVGQSGFAPSLATSYSHHGTRWIFHLRHGVVSCAGNPLTSADVVYTFRRALSVSGASPVTDFLGVVSGVFSGAELAPKAPASTKVLHDQVKAINRYTVEFNQVHPDGLFPSTLAVFASLIFDEKAMKAHATASDPYSHNYTNTTGAPSFGPYCLSKWIKGSEMDYTANPHYWAGEPHFTKIILRQVPADSDRVAAVQGGQANVATSLTPQEYKLLAKGSQSQVLGGVASTTLLLGINYEYPPFNTPKGRLIRQAIAYAIPYNQLAQNNYLGTAFKLNGLFPSTANGYEAISPYTTNLAKAKALMAQAGYPGGKGLPKNSPAFQLAYVAERGTLLQPIANTIKSSLAQIGIPIQLSPIPQSQENTDELTKFNLGMFLRDDNRPLDPDVGYGTLLYYVSKAGGALEPSTNYDNPTIDKLYKQSSTETGAARLATLHQIQKILIGDLPLVPLLQNTDQIAVSKGITGYLVNAGNIVIWAPLK